jgi:hypothetical protein
MSFPTSCHRRDAHSRGNGKILLDPKCNCKQTSKVHDCCSVEGNFPRDNCKPVPKVAIDSENVNKSTPLSTTSIIKSYFIRKA